MLVLVLWLLVTRFNFCGDIFLKVSITVDAANRHDMKRTKATLQSIVVHRPNQQSNQNNTYVYG
ncbi:MAG TPA: hypothetical protein VE076_02705 [Nitrososphaeraceae archaeon]|nr:hypothetical protein [Nitrososphaeraceae archaeon]